LFQALGITKPVDEFVLRRDANAGFKLFNPGAATGTQEYQEDSKQENDASA